MKVVSTCRRLPILAFSTCPQIDFLTSDLGILLQKCGRNGSLRHAQEIHARIIKSKALVDDDVCPWNELLKFYVKVGSSEDAERVFDNMSAKNAVSFNAIISANVKKGQPRKALKFFREMYLSGVRPTPHTFSSLFRACAESRDINYGRQLHSHLIKFGLELTSGNDFHVYVGSALLDMYAKCRRIDCSRRVFDSLDSCDLIFWNVMISAYIKSVQFDCAMELFSDMRSREDMRKPDAFTFTTLLQQFTSPPSLKQGRMFHSLIIKSGFALVRSQECLEVCETALGNALLTVYFKCGDPDSANQVFDEMPSKNIVSWSAMISGYAQNGFPDTAMAYFAEIHRQKSMAIKPNHYAFISALNACADSANLGQGKHIHAFAVKSGFDSANTSVGNALLDMYSKCGSIEDSWQVFRGIARKDCVTWAAMITACAQHGLGGEALTLFEEMQEAGVKAQSATFLGLLWACAHMGLVERGIALFEAMTRAHGVSPRLEHFACVVDLLGRAGKVEEAVNLVRRMGFERNPEVVETLLGACVSHGKIELGKEVAKQLLQLECDDAQKNSVYVLLSNMFAGAGLWEAKADVRRFVAERGLRKEIGCSWISLKGVLYRFTAS